MIYKIRTVDVWDTLLRRDCHPECIKLATAAYVFYALPGRFKPIYSGYWEIYRARVDTETYMARAAGSAGKDQEYEIVDVFRRWLETILMLPFDNDLPDVLANYELSVEIKRTFRDADIEYFLQQYIAEKTLFLSDFYMTADMLKQLLAQKGLSHVYEDGLSSCDVGLNKRSGALFRYLHERYGIKPEEHVHIGDHPWSDVEMPLSLGVKGISFVPEHSHSAREQREGLFVSRDVLFQHLRRLSIQASITPLSKLQTIEASAFRFGIEAAPLFIGFAMWIAEEAVVQKLDKIFFLTREGEFFQRIYETIFPTNEFFGHPLPSQEQLEVSRLATFVASMEAVSIEEFNRIWRLNRSQKISGLFSTLGLECESFSELLKEVGLQPTDIIDNPEDSEPLKKLISSTIFINAVQKQMQEQRGLLSCYLETKGLTQNGNVGVVDIGWRGTIQDNLARIKSTAHLHGMYLGLRKVINPQGRNTTKSAYGVNELSDPDKAALFEAFAVLEMLCTSNKGSAERYLMIDGKVEAQRKVSEDENRSHDEFSIHFQNGVACASKVWGPYLERYVVSSMELHKSAVHIWKKLSTNPDTDLARIFIDTPQHDVFGFGEIFQKNKAPALSTIALSAVSSHSRRQVIDYIRRVQWTSGVKHLEGIGLVHKAILIGLFKLANAVKRYRMKSRRS